MQITVWLKPVTGMGDGMADTHCATCKHLVKPTSYKCPTCGAMLLENVEQERLKVRRQTAIFTGCVWALGIGVLWIGVIIYGYATRPPSPETIAKQRAEAEAKAVQQASDRAQGLHCLLPILGYNQSFVDAVKARLRDPDSFEHDRTRIAPANGEGQHRVIMEYRAKNGFGGVNREVATGTLDHVSCVITSVEISQ